MIPGMHMLKRRSARIVAAVLVIAAASGAAATVARAVSVGPMSVFMDHRTRTATITLYNPNPLPEEIEVSFAFGYPQSDSAGNVTVPLSEQAPEGEPSAVEWLRAFPRRLVLEPGQQQVVRILAQPPAELADGEYWSRILVVAQGGRPPVEQQLQPDVRVSIAMRTIIVASLNYRKGRLGTGVDVKSAALEPAGDSARFTIDLARRGEAAYLGRIRVQALDASGRVVEEVEDVASVYRTLRRRFTFAGDVARVRYTLETERPDLGQANILAAAPVTGTVDMTR